MRSSLSHWNNQTLFIKLNKLYVLVITSILMLNFLKFRSVKFFSSYGSNTISACYTNSTLKFKWAANLPICCEGMPPPGCQPCQNSKSNVIRRNLWLHKCLSVYITGRPFRKILRNVSRWELLLANPASSRLEHIKPIPITQHVMLGLWSVFSQSGLQHPKHHRRKNDGWWKIAVKNSEKRTEKS